MTILPNYDIMILNLIMRGGKMKQFFKKFATICLSLVLMAGTFCVTSVEVEAATSTMTCAGFISNTEHRIYIDTMMQYYIDNNSSLRTALSNRKSVIFMFEGGSDNFPGSPYAEDPNNMRDQAVCIVVQKVGGVNTIVFSSEYCSSLPSLPSDTSGGDYDRQTTLMDGIYSVQTVNHQGNYGALWTDAWQGYYTPPSNPNGVVKGASGINIHTRSSGAAGYSNSWGCQLIGYGAGSGNSFNTFMRTVTGIDQDVYTSSMYTYSSSNLYKDVGYYVVDRQLALEGLEGMYTKTAIANMTTASRNARANAVFTNQHVDTAYSSSGTVSVNNGTTIRDLPCTASVDSASQLLETATASTYDVVGLCKNDQNELWYEVNLKTKSGTGYVFAGSTSSFASKNDITIGSDATLPEQIDKCSAYPVKGTISTANSKLDSVDVKVTNFGETTRITGQGATDVNLKSVNIATTSLSIGGASKTLDDTILFNELDIGNYTMLITATTKIYYAEGTTLKQTTETSTKAIHFSIVDGTCTHNYTLQTTVKATCSEGGYSKYACSKCSSSYVTLVTEAGEHTFAPATCCAPETCTRCGETRGYVNSDNHSFDNTWLFDTTSHWRACACGITTTPAAHDFKGDDVCDRCKYQQNVAGDGSGSASQPSGEGTATPAPSPSNNGTTTVVVVAASVAGVGTLGTAGYFIFRRKFF